MKPAHPFTVVQTPAPRHPDERLGQALQAARQAGRDEAERPNYMRGWRTGVLHGLLAGGLVGAATVFALVQLGRLIGAALGA